MKVSKESGSVNANSSFYGFCPTNKYQMNVQFVKNRTTWKCYSQYTEACNTSTAHRCISIQCLCGNFKDFTGSVR